MIPQIKEAPPLSARMQIGGVQPSRVFFVGAFSRKGKGKKMEMFCVTKSKTKAHLAELQKVSDLRFVFITSHQSSALHETQ